MWKQTRRPFGPRPIGPKVVKDTVGAQDGHPTRTHYSCRERLMNTDCVLPLDFAIDSTRFGVWVDQVDLRSVTDRGPSRCLHLSGGVRGAVGGLPSAVGGEAVPRGVSWPTPPSLGGDGSSGPECIRTSTPTPYTQSVRKSADGERGRPSDRLPDGWDADSPGRGGPRRSEVKTTRAYQRWALPEAL
jgi:hypothetical protein